MYGFFELYAFNINFCSCTLCEVAGKIRFRSSTIPEKTRTNLANSYCALEVDREKSRYQKKRERISQVRTVR